jgi:hypothetical protein
VAGGQPGAPRISDFLLSLAQDDNRLRAYLRDRSGTLRKSNLTAAQQRILLSDDHVQIRNAAAAETNTRQEDFFLLIVFFKGKRPWWKRLLGSGG